MAGAVPIGHVSSNWFVTLAEQLSVPTARKTLRIEQVFAGAVRLLVKFVEAPGANEAMSFTFVLADCGSRNTAMLYRGILPWLMTVTR